MRVTTRQLSERAATNRTRGFRIMFGMLFIDDRGSGEQVARGQDPAFPSRKIAITEVVSREGTSWLSNARFIARLSRSSATDLNLGMFESRPACSTVHCRRECSLPMS